MADPSAKILKQVEFYFSDSNLPRDKFMQEHTKQNDGWAEIAVIASFNKMKTLSTDLAVVVAALRASPVLLEVDEEGVKVRRKTPVPENVDNIKNAIYVKGLPKDFDIEPIKEFLAPHMQAGEEISCVRLRRFPDKTFKGSAFIEFNSEAVAERVSKLELKTTEDAEEPLSLQMKADYLARKKAERYAKKGGPSEGGAKRKREGEEGEDGAVEKEAEKEFKRDIVLDSIVCVSGVEVTGSRENIKAAIESSGAQVAFVEFNKGNAKGYVRLHRDSTVMAAAAVAKLQEEKTTIGEAPADYAVLTGDDETAYWAKLFDLQEGSRAGRKKGGKGGKGGRGGKGGKGGRGGKKAKN